MLNKSQSNKRNSWKYATVLPLLGAFLFLFQVKTVAQEKVNVKQVNKTKQESVNLNSSKTEKDLITFSKGKEIYINGKKSNAEELNKLNPNEIEKIDVIKKTKQEAILVTTKHLTKPIKITNKEFYIDDVKSTEAEFSQLDKNRIDKMDVNTVENTVRITTKKLNDEKPVIIVDNVFMDSNFNIETIDQSKIKSINVLKGKVAQDKFGHSSAIEVTTISLENIQKH